MAAGQLAIQRLLQRTLTESKAKNPSYSVRALAKRIGLHASATNEILKGQRRISIALARKILRNLHLDPSERSEILRFFRSERDRGPADKGAEASVLKLSAEQFLLISDWVHFAILNLVHTKGFRNDPAWIAKRLAITVPKTESAIKRLSGLGLIHIAKDGAIHRTYAKINTSDDVRDASVQKSHLADMELAKSKLMRLPVDLRDFTSITMALSPNVLSKAKELIRRLQDEVSDLSTEEPSEVYRMAVYLFPLTDPTAKEIE